MKSWFLVFAFFLSAVCTNAQIFHEDFEVADSVSGSSNSSSIWAQNGRLATSGLNCDSASLLNIGDTLILSTLAFSTIGFDSIFLYFNHIGKMEFFDAGCIEVSTDSGSTWSRLMDDMGGPNNNCTYLGHGLFKSQGSRFMEASYGQWFPGIAISPNNSWWKREIFDLTSALSNTPYAQIRFVLYDVNLNGGASRSGWFIDDILIDTLLNTDLSVFANKVTGTVFFDANSDLVFDTTETPVRNQFVELPGLNNWVWTGTMGYYELGTNAIGNFDIQCNSNLLNNPDFSVVPVVQTANFTGLNQIDSLNDFAIQPVGVKNDLNIQITKLNGTINFLGRYRIQYENAGNTILYPTISFYGDSSITFNQCPVTPALISMDSVYWILPPMGPFTTRTFFVFFNIPGNWFDPGSYAASATIYPISGDFNLIDNSDTTNSWNLTGFPFDPNSIQVDKDTLTTTEISNSPFLEYIIHFQNVGTDTATNVLIENLINSNLDLQTLEILGTSHPMDILFNTINNPRLLKFKFENILLPDSNVNEPASNGFICYRIKPLSTLVAGNSIPNFADIYFDFNAPITTNTALTTIVDPTSLNDNPGENGLLQIFPNPVINEFTISFDKNDNPPVLIEIYNMYGQKVKTLNSGLQGTGKFQQVFDVSDLTNGVYFINYKNGNRSITAKFLKMEN